MTRDFEDHCWRGFVDEKTEEIYSHYKRDVFVGADARQRVGNDDRLDQAHGRRDHRPHAELGDAPHALFVMAP